MATVVPQNGAPTQVAGTSQGVSALRRPTAPVQAILAHLQRQQQQKQASTPGAGTGPTQFGAVTAPVVSTVVPPASSNPAIKTYGGPGAVPLPLSLGGAAVLHARGISGASGTELGQSLLQSSADFGPSPSAPTFGSTPTPTKALLGPMAQSFNVDPNKMRMLLQHHHHHHHHHHMTAVHHPSISGNLSTGTSKQTSPQKPMLTVAQLEHQRQADEMKTVQEKFGYSEEQMKYRARFVRFYNKYNPEKVSEVDNLLAKFAGNLEKVIEAMVRKYGPEPPQPADPLPPTPKAQPLPPHVASAPKLHLKVDSGIDHPEDTSAKKLGYTEAQQRYRTRIINFYEKYNRDKINEVDSILEKFKGKEESIITALVQKYGPEPPTAPPISLQVLLGKSVPRKSSVADAKASVSITPSPAAKAATNRRHRLEALSAMIVDSDEDDDDDDATVVEHKQDEDLLDVVDDIQPISSVLAAEPKAPAEEKNKSATESPMVDSLPTNHVDRVNDSSALMKSGSLPFSGVMQWPPPLLPTPIPSTPAERTQQPKENPPGRISEVIDLSEQSPPLIISMTERPYSLVESNKQKAKETEKSKQKDNVPSIVEKTTQKTASVPKRVSETTRMKIELKKEFSKQQTPLEKRQGKKPSNFSTLAIEAAARETPQDFERSREQQKEPKPQMTPEKERDVTARKLKIDENESTENGSDDEDEMEKPPWNDLRPKPTPIDPTASSTIRAKTYADGLRRKHLRLPSDAMLAPRKYGSENDSGSRQLTRNGVKSPVSSGSSPLMTWRSPLVKQQNVASQEVLERRLRGAQALERARSSTPTRSRSLDTPTKNSKAAERTPRGRVHSAKPPIPFARSASCDGASPYEHTVGQGQIVVDRRAFVPNIKNPPLPQDGFFGRAKTAVRIGAPNGSRYEYIGATLGTGGNADGEAFCTHSTLGSLQDGRSEGWGAALTPFDTYSSFKKATTAGHQSTKGSAWALAPVGHSVFETRDLTKGNIIRSSGSDAVVVGVIRDRPRGVDAVAQQEATAARLSRPRRPTMRSHSQEKTIINRARSASTGR